MEFVLEMIPHCLYLSVAFKVCICLCILEAQLVVTFQKINHYKGIDTFVLIVRTHADQKQVECVRPLPIHRLKKMPPAEREEFSVAFLQCLSHRRDGQGRRDEISVRILDKGEQLHIHDSEICIHILVDLLLRKERISVEYTISLVYELEYLLSVSFLLDLSLGQLPDFQSISSLDSLCNASMSFRRSLRQCEPVLDPACLLMVSELLHMLRIIRMIVDQRHCADTVISFHEHSLRIEIGETERTGHICHSA